jgi:hypothetical protein
MDRYSQSTVLSDLRGHPPSDGGPSGGRPGMAGSTSHPGRPRPSRRRHPAH